jgi:hypothetical protein
LIGDQPDARPLPTQDNTNRTNAEKHSCLEWDSNPRFQCSSERRQFTPQTARPLWEAVTMARYGLAQAISRHLPTAAARVRAHVRSRGICGGQSGTGVGFLRVLLFSLPILNPPTAPHSSSSIIRSWYNRPNNGRSTKWTQSHATRRN